MARARNKLNTKVVAGLGAGRHSDGGGLYLDRDRFGRARWLYFFVWNDKRREMGLGPYPVVSLAAARKARDEAERLVREGRDPIAERDKARQAARAVPTFGEVADALIEAKKPGWRNAKHQDQWKQSLEVLAKALRDKPVNTIDTEAVLSVLRPHWSSKPETASRLRQRIEAVLDAAKAAGHRAGENPATWRGHLSHLLPRPSKVEKGHHPAMAYQEVPDFVGKLHAHQGRSIAAFALEFLILTAARSGEVRGATWDEIDLKANVWTLSPERMKAGRTHRVPLCDRAVTILSEVKKVGSGAQVFPGRSEGGKLSHLTMSKVMARLGAEDASPHGFRSAFRDWAGNETAFPREVAEAALAHAVGDETERAYRRGDALEKRRAMMTAWAAFIEPASPDNVIPPRPAGREHQESGAA
ncbi:tyrosine-type recombinase/integrase [Enterovirga rhinocerotis]|uniref:Integrase n=1 Tax=Enterovirga rhinocerotis TaxID=1339210 RepID=A0A4R7BXD9_9HYPH|nr:site-specific integrase [Enterovirga rhinocerotis]TDR90251.1 integrase [Enterovirga rhinocerotis]